MARTHRIAVLPGDGIGKETVPESLKVLDAASRKFGFGLELTHFDWSCETYKETGMMMPADGLDQLAKSDSVLLGAVGWPGVRTPPANRTEANIDFHVVRENSEGA
jgi:tartrate dehydrogenase/decarboxylase/D-malate dehydrogenase